MTIYQPTRDEMVRLLSTPRLTTYTEACGGEIPRALDLYRWNLDLSMAFFGSIHYFEVAFRNHVDMAMTKWMQAEYEKMGGQKDRAPHWLDDKRDLVLGKSPIDHSCINSKTKTIISSAKKQAARRHNPPSEGHIISEITMGTWVWILKPGSRDSPWVNALKNSFDGNVQKSKLTESLDQLVDLRNRIAHHEPIFDLDLIEEYNNLIRTSEIISLRLAWWIDSTSQVEKMIRSQPH